MKQILLVTLAALLLTSCSNKSSGSKKITTNLDIATVKVQRELEQLSKVKDEKREFVALLDTDNSDYLLGLIEESGGEVLSYNSSTGYIHFTSEAHLIQEVIALRQVQKVSFNTEIETSIPASNTLTSPKEMTSAMMATKDLYSKDLMKVTELKRELERDGVVLDGSTATIAVFDTGLDISRTDVFQDRIVELRTIRKTDNAVLTDAETVVLGGVEYLRGAIQDQEILIEKSERLSADRDYYIGFFKESQFNVLGGYGNSKSNDLNQDGYISAVFPVVAYMNDNGQLEAYVNVNSSLIYGSDGDRSIEDENLLMDFNWVAKNIEDRYHEDKEKPIKSYYKYTTRLDVSSGGTDRNKGVVNLGITAEEGRELKDGKLLNLVKKEGVPPIYIIGLVGFDIGGHGTHCTGIAAGNFLKAPQFSSGASKAKIVGVSMLGTRHSPNDFMETMQKVIDNNENVIFSFSFGASSMINTLGGDVTAEFYDKVAMKDGVAILKAAGNSGPGINSHGITTSALTLDVANYYSTNSRNTYNTSGYNYGFYEVFVSASSSRGPMIDGALKPDIGAPGWAMSSIPLRKKTGGSYKAYEYWPGTSMATPNVASVVALLYDAANKTGLKDGIATNTPFNISTLHKVIKNSAIPYDKLQTADCRALSEKHCELESKEYEFSWIDGGAGRVNAVGAWSILNDIIGGPLKFYSTKTESRMPGYEGWSYGLYAVDEIPSRVDFKLQDRTPLKAIDDLLSVESFVLKSDSPWVSFDKDHTRKERVIELIPGESPNITVYIDRDKLIENGRLKPGIHSTVLKAYNMNSDKYYDWVFPITLVGLDTTFSQDMNNGTFSSKGFIPTSQFKRFTIPVDTDQATLLFDLQTSVSLPGSFYVRVFYQGMELNLGRMFGVDKNWVDSSTRYELGNNTSTFALPNLFKGEYEVIVVASDDASYEDNGKRGSFYSLEINKLSLDIGGITEQRNNTTSFIQLTDVSANRYLSIAEANIELDSFKLSRQVQVKNKKQTLIPFTVAKDAERIEITSNYFGVGYNMDIDLYLKDKSGKTIRKSTFSQSDERIFLNIDTKSAGTEFTLVVDGHSVSNEQDHFNVDIVQRLKDKVVLATSMRDSYLKKEIASRGFLKAGSVYNFDVKVDLRKLDSIGVHEDFSPVLKAVFSATYSGDKSAVVLDKVI